jgi:hypothetical protein
MELTDEDLRSVLNDVVEILAALLNPLQFDGMKVEILAENGDGVTWDWLEEKFEADCGLWGFVRLVGPSPSSKVKSTMLKDSAQVLLARDIVEERAIDNICASSGMTELATDKVEGLSDVELVQWATDEDGKFKDE